MTDINTPNPETASQAYPADLSHMGYNRNTDGTMESVQINIRTTRMLADMLDKIVEEGYYRNRTEAVNEGIRLLIRKYQVEGVVKRIEKLRQGKKSIMPSEELIRQMRDEEAR